MRGGEGRRGRQGGGGAGGKEGGYRAGGCHSSSYNLSWDQTLKSNFPAKLFSILLFYPWRVVPASCLLTVRCLPGWCLPCLATPRFQPPVELEPPSERGPPPLPLIWPGDSSSQNKVFVSFVLDSKIKPCMLDISNLTGGVLGHTNQKRR